MNWFRDESAKLRAEDRAAVSAILLGRDPRTLYLGLDALKRQGRLPDTWDETLSDFYWTFL